MAELTLRVITPESIPLDTTVTSVVVPAVDGEIGILPRHAGMVAALDAGVLRYQAGGKTEGLFVSGGFCEVRGKTVRVVTEAGESPDAIDEERAAAAEKRARDRLSNLQSTAGEPIDLLRAQAALRRAIMRLKAKKQIR